MPTVAANELVPVARDKHRWLGCRVHGGVRERTGGIGDDLRPISGSRRGLPTCEGKTNLSSHFEEDKTKFYLLRKTKKIVEIHTTMDAREQRVKRKNCLLQCRVSDDVCVIVRRVISESKNRCSNVIDVCTRIGYFKNILQCSGNDR